MKKNVLLISQSLYGGGAEKVVANLSLELAKFYNVYIVTYEDNTKEYKYQGTRLNINIPGGNIGIIEKLKNAYRRIKIIRRIKIDYDIDYAISFVPQTDYANVFSDVKGTNCIIEVSSNSSMAFTGVLGKWFRKIVLSLADTIVSVSYGSSLDLINNFGINRKKIKVIYNSCDIEQIKKKKEMKSLDYLKLGRKYIVTAGSFRYPKGHWHLIKAFACISDEIKDYDLVILGDGEYREQYEELINNLNLDRSRIIMPGFLDNPYPVIKNASLFIFTSVFEGFGNVLIEAMACGVPVFSVDCDFGPKEIISPNINYKNSLKGFQKGEYGWLFEKWNKEDIDVTNHISAKEKEFGKCIVQCLLDKESLEFYRIAGYNRCMDFCNEKFGKNLMELFGDHGKV